MPKKISLQSQDVKNMHVRWLNPTKNLNNALPILGVFCVLKLYIGVKFNFAQKRMVVFVFQV